MLSINARPNFRVTLSKPTIQLRNGISVLSLLLFGIAMLPWVYTYLPSQDGATHIEIAHIVADLTSGSKTLNAEFYQLRPRFFTNLATEAISIPLLHVIDAVTVEKVMFSLVSLGLPLGLMACMLAVVRKFSSFMILVLPYGYTTTLASGNFNFLLGMVVGFFLLAAILSDCRAPGPARIGAYAATWSILSLIHPAATLVMLINAGIVVTFWAGYAWPSNRHLAFRIVIAHGVAVLPALGVLAAFFLFSPPSDMEYQRSLFLRLREFVLEYELYKLGRVEIVLAFALSSVIVVLALLAMSYRKKLTFRHLDFLLVISVVWFGIYLIAPNKLSGGDAFVSRIEILPWIFALIWLSGQELPLRAQQCVLLIGLLIQGCFLFSAYWTHKAISDDMTNYFDMASYIPDNSVVVPVVGEQRALYPSGEPVGTKGMPFQHLYNYVAVQKDAVFLENWNAHYRVANVQYRADADPYPVVWSGDTAGGIAILEEKIKPRPLFLFVWRVSEDTKLWTDLAKLIKIDFEPVVVKGDSMISGVFRSKVDR